MNQTEACAREKTRAPRTVSQCQLYFVSYSVDVAWKKRAKSDDGTGDSLGPIQIFTSGNGMLVEGRRRRRLSPPAAGGSADELAKLVDLRDGGLITEAEF